MVNWLTDCSSGDGSQRRYVSLGSTPALVFWDRVSLNHCGIQVFSPSALASGSLGLQVCVLLLPGSLSMHQTLTHPWRPSCGRVTCSSEQLQKGLGTFSLLCSRPVPFACALWQETGREVSWHSSTNTLEINLSDGKHHFQGTRWARLPVGSCRNQRKEQ